MFLQATVVGQGSTKVTFYLSEGRSYNGHDVEIGRTTASSGTVADHRFGALRGLIDGNYSQ